MGTRKVDGEIVLVRGRSSSFEGDVQHGMRDGMRDDNDDAVERAKSCDSVDEELHKISCDVWWSLRPPIVSSGNHIL